MMIEACRVESSGASKAISRFFTSMRKDQERKQDAYRLSLNDHKKPQNKLRDVGCLYGVGRVMSSSKDHCQEESWRSFRELVRW